MKEYNVSEIQGLSLFVNRIKDARRSLVNDRQRLIKINNSIDSISPEDAVTYNTCPALRAEMDKLITAFEQFKYVVENGFENKELDEESEESEEVAQSIEGEESESDVIEPQDLAKFVESKTNEPEVVVETVEPEVEKKPIHVLVIDKLPANCVECDRLPNGIDIAACEERTGKEPDLDSDTRPEHCPITSVY